MKRNFGTLTLLVVILMATTIGCDRADRQIIPIEAAPPDEIMPMGPASDEESSVRYGLTDTYDNVRNGARLVISYDAATDAFTGNVTNTTGAILTQVRVEVHLYDGAVTVDELGPTPNVDLQPGESHAITLPAMGHAFTEWVAHPEVGPSSAGGGEGDGEHGQGAAGEGGAEGAEGAGGGEGAEGAGAAGEGAEGGEGAGGGEGGGEHGQGGEGAEGGGN